MNRNLYQNPDGSFYIEAYDGGNPYLDAPDNAAWNTDGLLGTLEDMGNGYADVALLLRPIDTEGDAKYDMPPYQLEIAQQLGSLVNCYAIQGQIVRGENGIPRNVSNWTHVTLLYKETRSSGAEVLTPIVTLLDSTHPANQYYDEE